MHNLNIILPGISSLDYFSVHFSVILLYVFLLMLVFKPLSAYELTHPSYDILPVHHHPRPVNPGYGSSS